MPSFTGNHSAMDHPAGSAVPATTGRSSNQQTQNGHGAMDLAGSVSTVPAAAGRSSNQETENGHGAFRPFDADDVNLHWISITNIHWLFASADLVRGFLPHCVRIDRAISQDIVFEVAFESREAAEEAINLYQNNIRMSHQTAWRFQHGRHTGSQHELGNGGMGEGQDILIGRPLHTGLNGTRVVDPRFGRDCLLLHIDGMRAEEGVLIGPDSKVVVAFFIDQRVPKEVILPLFETIGRVTTCYVWPQTSQLQGSFAVIVHYEHWEDVSSAVQRFDEEIMIFDLIWAVVGVHFHPP